MSEDDARWKSSNCWSTSRGSGRIRHDGSCLLDRPFRGLGYCRTWHTSVNVCLSMLLYADNLLGKKIVRVGNWKLVNPGTPYSFWVGRCDGAGDARAHGKESHLRITARWAMAISSVPNSTPSLSSSARSFGTRVAGGSCLRPDGCRQRESAGSRTCDRRCLCFHPRRQAARFGAC